MNGSNKLVVPQAREAMNTAQTARYTRADRTAIGHEVEVKYIASIHV